MQQAAQARKNRKIIDFGVLYIATGVMPNGGAASLIHPPRTRGGTFIHIYIYIYNYYAAHMYHASGMGARLGDCDYEPTHHPYFQLEIQLNQASGACRVPLAQRWAGNIV